MRRHLAPIFIVQFLIIGVLVSPGGAEETGDAREPVHVQFYMVALLFILFDIEAIFLYPWALVYSDLKVFGFIEMVLYIAILLTGYIYLWKKGALDWSR